MLSKLFILSSFWGPFQKPLRSGDEVGFFAKGIIIILIVIHADVDLNKRKFMDT